ncbi:MAG: PilN domain-containing protein, partial [Bacteroidota bacterium]
ASRTEGAALLVAEADGATVVETSGGRVRAVHRVEGGPAVAVSEAQALGAGGRLVIAGPEAAPALAAASDVFGDAARLAHLPDGLASEYALAYGLAVEAAVPALEGVDLLAPETRAKAEVELEKQTGQRAVLTVALVLLAALALVESASWAFASGLDGAEAEALARADEIAAVEAARADVDRLQREIRSAQSSQSERTRQSVLLDRVGGSVPEGVWLASFAADAADLAITGYALDYGGVEQALAVLEVEPALTGVRLIRTTRLTGETTAGLTRPVVAFEVRADVRPGAL